MESNSEGQPSTFARPITGSSPTSFQNIPQDGLSLRLPNHMRMLFARGASATVSAEAQQPSSGDLPVLKPNYISNAIHTAAADINYAPDLASSAAVPQFEEIRDGGNGYAAIDPSFDHNASVQLSQAQAPLPMPNMYNHRWSQPQLTTAVHPVPPLASVVESAHHHQHPNFYYPLNPANFQATATRSQSPYQTVPAGVIPSNSTFAQFEDKLPPWRQPYPPEAQPVAFSGIPMEMENIPVTNSLGSDIFLARNHTLPPNGLGYGQPMGNHPTQPNAVIPPSSEVPPIRTEVRPAGNAGDHTQALGNGGSSREYQSESIDVDIEANNLCGGVNWKMQIQPIDLSKDTEEPSKMKKTRKKKENVSEQQPRMYKIPRKSDDATPSLGKSTTTSNQMDGNDGANKTSFTDPLCLPRRQHTGPPIRPFPSPAPTNSPIRRSPRNAKSKSRKPDFELTDSSKQAQPSDANVDVPLGGLGKSTRESNTETSGFRGRSCSNHKRRRPNSGAEVEGPAKESDGICRTEKRRNTTILDKRRTKHVARKRMSKKQAPIKQPTEASTKEEAANEDSDDLSEMIRNKKVPTIGGRRVPARSHGDSPLSNTVGDASQSDDESFGAVGNELSSDDDDGTSVKTLPRQRRTPHQAVSEAITISDSPVQTRIPRVPRSPGTPRTSRTPRKSKTAGASRGVASRSKRNDVVHDSDDEHFSASRKDCADEIKRQSEEGKQRGNKTMKRSKTLSSPVNLVSPTPSGLERKGVRRSPRHTKGKSSGKQRFDGLVADSSDDDFDVSRVSARTRGKTKRRTPANDTTTRAYSKKQNTSLQRGAESEGRFSRVEKRDIGMDLMDEEPKSPCISPSDEDSDVGAEFPSQEQGSQPIDLKVKIVAKRKKAGPKTFLEREFHKLSTDELSIIRVAFIKRYPSPPSNMQAQGRYEAAHGTAMTSGMVQRTWETQLKPWSKRWWDFYLDFNQKVREKKAAKSRNKDPTLKESEVKSWVEEYYREHGDAKPNVPAAATEAAANTNMEPQ